jgi:hypothetical protein
VVYRASLPLSPSFWASLDSFPHLNPPYPAFSHPATHLRLLVPSFRSQRYGRFGINPISKDQLASTFSKVQKGDHIIQSPPPRPQHQC